MQSPIAAVRLAVACMSLVLLAGCAANATPSPSSTNPSSAPSATTPAASAASSPSATTGASPTATDSVVGTDVVTLADGLRVRSAPRLSGDSDMKEPLLPLGTELYVLDGPVSASGYVWYEVVPLTSRTLPSGWVASADRDGEPWIAAGDFDCPAVPTDFRSLASLPPGVGLACFPQVPITLQARLISCNCDIDGAWYTPSWFSRGGGTSELLVAPDVTSAPPNMADWFVLNLDPAGDHPDVLPVGEVVEVTGIFDHPAAASCTRTEMDGQPVPSQGCRLEFAVTQLVAT